MKLLCLADLHLGRQPSSRLPGGLARERDDLGPARAWRDAVDLAIRDRYDAVLVAGDLVDQDDDVYEAYHALRAGAERLAGRGVPLIAVAGNHDGQVLPRLVAHVPAVTLLGAGGRWERTTVHGAGGDHLDVLGWSMPGPVHPRSPLTDVPSRRGRTPTIGLLHGDRDGAGPYAPFASADLAALDVDAWLLGHVHAPDPLDGPRPSGYLGSLVGTDPGEPGPRGPWRVVLDGGRVRAEHLPSAPLRWEEVAVDASGADGPADLDDAVLDALARAERRLDAAAVRPHVVGVRLRVHGRTPHAAALRGALARERLARIGGLRDGVHWFVHDAVDEMAPDRPLDELARGSDPAALLARRILALRNGGEARDALLRRARPDVEAAHQGRPFRSALDGRLDDAALADVLERAATRALDALLAQRSDA